MLGMNTFTFCMGKTEPRISSTEHLLSICSAIEFDLIPVILETIMNLFVNLKHANATSCG